MRIRVDKEQEYRATVEDGLMRLWEQSVFNRGSVARTAGSSGPAKQTDEQSHGDECNDGQQKHNQDLE